LGNIFFDNLFVLPLNIIFVVSQQKINKRNGRKLLRDFAMGANRRVLQFITYFPSAILPGTTGKKRKKGLNSKNFL